jgi:ribokinase
MLLRPREPVEARQPGRERLAIGDNRRVAGGRVLVVGSVNVDLVVVAPRLPGPGETVTGGDVARYQGGKGGNQATAAARLGAQVAFVGAVGADDMGREARAALAAEGIDLAGLVETSRPTGVALIVVDPHAENQIAVAPGANGDVHAGQVAAALRRLAPGPLDVVLVCREIPPDGVRAALELGRDAGAITILNPAPADGADRPTLALADILTPNEIELGLLVDGRPAADPEHAARHYLASGGGTRPRPTRGGRADREPAVVVTLGAAGALIVRNGAATVSIPSPAVDPLDTTGAGDAFNGALAAGLADRLDLAEAVGRAVAAAAVSTTRRGARGGMPTSAELEGFLAGT